MLYYSSANTNYPSVLYILGWGWAKDQPMGSHLYGHSIASTQTTECQSWKTPQKSSSANPLFKKKKQKTNIQIPEPEKVSAMALFSRLVRAKVRAGASSSPMLTMMSHGAQNTFMWDSRKSRISFAFLKKFSQHNRTVLGAKAIKRTDIRLLNNCCVFIL